jgi:hypothetical protein
MTCFSFFANVVFEKNQRCLRGQAHTTSTVAAKYKTGRTEQRTHLRWGEERATGRLGGRWRVEARGADLGVGGWGEGTGGGAIIYFTRHEIKIK